MCSKLEKTEQEVTVYFKLSECVCVGTEDNCDK
jgi:hypothetical protein